jgi:phage terminase Nu1 subunit (DNA packaging protein)
MFSKVTDTFNTPTDLIGRRLTRLTPHQIDLIKQAITKAREAGHPEASGNVMLAILMGSGIDQVDTYLADLKTQKG